MQKTMHRSKTSPALLQQNISRTPALKHLLHSRNKTSPRLPQQNISRCKQHEGGGPAGS